MKATARNSVTRGETHVWRGRGADPEPRPGARWRRVGGCVVRRRERRAPGRRRRARWPRRLRVGRQQVDAVTDAQQRRRRRRRAAAPACTVRSGWASARPAADQADVGDRLAAPQRGGEHPAGAVVGQPVGRRCPARSRRRRGRPVRRPRPAARSCAATGTATVGGGRARAWPAARRAPPAAATAAASGRRRARTRRRERAPAAAYVVDRGMRATLGRRPAPRPRVVHRPADGSAGGGPCGRLAGSRVDAGLTRSRRPRIPTRTSPSRGRRRAEDPTASRRSPRSTEAERRGAAVGAVEARALEDHADGVEDLAQPALALRAVGERVVAEALELLERVTALGAGVLVGGHGNLRGSALRESAIRDGPATRWHSARSRLPRVRHNAHTMTEQPAPPDDRLRRGAQTVPGRRRACLRWSAYVVGRHRAARGAAARGHRRAFVRCARCPATTASSRSPGLDGRGRGDPRRRTASPQIYADTDADLMRAQGFVARPGAVLRDGRAPPRHRRPALRAVRRGRPRDRQGASARWAGAGSPSRSCALLDPETREAPRRRTPRASTPTSSRTARPRWPSSTPSSALTGLDYEPEPWTPVDSLAWLKAMAWDLRGNMDDEIDRVLASLDHTPEEVAELYPAYTYDAAPADRRAAAASSTASSSRTPPATRPATRAARRTPREIVAALERRCATRLARVPELLGRGDGIGSNSWVVDGEHSATGAAAAGQRPAPRRQHARHLDADGPALPRDHQRLPARRLRLHVLRRARA